MYRCASPRCRALPVLACSLVLLLAPAVTAAQVPTAVYVRAGRLVDVVDGRVLTDQAILIRDDRIERVGPAAEIPVPDGARVIDLSGATVLPGLIDAHVHLTGDADAHGYRSLAISLPRQALDGAANARKTLMAGFTTVRNVGAAGYTDVALRDAINDGDVPGPRMLVSGPALGITGGHCDDNLLPPEYGVTADGVADGPWAVRAMVRKNDKYGADLIKFCATGGVLSKGDTVGGMQYTQEEMDAIVDEAHKLGLKVAAHAHGTEGIKAAIRAGVDSVEHASLLDAEAIEMAKEHGTALSMDIYNDDYIMAMGEEAGILPESLEKERRIGLAQRQSFQAAHEAGALLVFGSDAGVYPHGDNGRQFAKMVRWGMTPMQAIQAATVANAELLGLSADVGAIEAGRYADLIAVDGDPIADVRQLEDVDFVMEGGEVVLDELTR